MVSAFGGHDLIMKAYKEAIKEPYAFLYINLMSKDLNQMFMI